MRNEKEKLRRKKEASAHQLMKYRIMAESAEQVKNWSATHKPYSMESTETKSP